MLIPFWGLKRLIKSPSLLALAALPFLIGLVVLVIGLVLAWNYNMAHFLLSIWGLDAETSTPWTQAFGANLILKSFVWILFLTTYSFLIYLVITVICSPVLSILAEKVLFTYNNKLSKVLKDKRFSLMESLYQIKISMFRSVIYLIVGVFFLFPMSFVPGLNILATFIFGLMLAFDCFDYTFEAMGWSFKQRLIFFRNNLSLFLGLGFVLFFSNMLPGAILFLLPILVVGAAEVYAKQWGNQ